jgi:hypothetical protein
LFLHMHFLYTHSAWNGHVTRAAQILNTDGLLGCEVQYGRLWNNILLWELPLILCVVAEQLDLKHVSVYFPVMNEICFRVKSLDHGWPILGPWAKHWPAKIFWMTLQKRKHYLTFSI